MTLRRLVLSPCIPMAFAALLASACSSESSDGIESCTGADCDPGESEDAGDTAVADSAGMDVTLDDASPDAEPDTEQDTGPECPEAQTCVSNQGDETCCSAGELCVAGACTRPGSPCSLLEPCPEGEFCDDLRGVCLPDESVPACTIRPAPDVFEPQQACRWTSEGLPAPALDDVVATPIVMNLTDDNGDGLTNVDDIPDIVFLTYDLEDDGCCNRTAAIRIVSGQCNDDGTMNTLATIADRDLTNDSGLAAGDLNGDGIPEIVAIMRQPVGENTRPQGVAIFERTADDGSAWQVQNENPDYPAWDEHTRGGPIISLADLEGDGSPEIIIGNVVLNADASLKWDGNALTLNEEGEATREIGIGNNAFLGPSSAVADVDNDRELEVIAGNTLYEADGTEAWTFEYTTSNSSCQGVLPCDGFNAVGNFDDDDFGEIVSIREGEVFVIEHTGELAHRIVLPSIDCDGNESGPPTIADFDGDGFPEIGTASADYYVVADVECVGESDVRPGQCRGDGILWQAENQDCSSRATGSSVFDFDADGRAEVVYADEVSFKILDGRNGAVLFSDDTHGSHTRIEMPVIADVDNDGRAEVIVPENSSREGLQGIDVWANDSWVRTRRVWNQHAYSVTHIEEDGTIPRQPSINWLSPGLNNFRQNVQPDGVFNAPNLTVTDVFIEAPISCENSTLQVGVTIRNDGRLGIASGQDVEITILTGEEAPFEVEQTGIRTVTDIPLAIGQSTTLRITVDADEGVSFSSPLRASAIVDPDEEARDCDRLNNEAMGEPIACPN